MNYYNNLDEEIKNKMYDIYLKENYYAEFQKEFREQIGRDFWFEHNPEALWHYYKRVNIIFRKEKIQKIFKKI